MAEDQQLEATATFADFGKCGTQRDVCPRAPAVDQHVMRIIRVLAGTLDGDPGIRPQRHIFVDFKAPWFEITDSLGQFGTKPKPS